MKPTSIWTNSKVTTMSKFKIGSRVRYVGPGIWGKIFLADLTIIDSVADGMPIGNGETNNSGQDMYRCQNGKSGVIWIFRKDELKAV